MSQPNETDALACLVLLPTGRDAELVCSTCRSHGIEPLKCKSCEDLLAGMNSGCGLAIVADEALGPPDWESLARWFECEPKWSEVPLVVLCRTHSTPASSGAVNRRHGTTFLLRPIRKITLLGVLEAGLESRRRQYQVRTLMEQLEQANRQLDTRARQLQRLTLALTQAEEVERRRVAHVLHDGLQQLLAAGRLPLRRLMSGKGTAVEQKDALKEVDSILQEAIDSSRTLSRELSPPLLYHAGLGPALELLAADYAAKYGLEVDVQWEEETSKLTESLRAFLFESTRELLLNVHKHACADSVRIDVVADAEMACLSVRDDGKGADPTRFEFGDASAQSGFGLFGIRERIELLGGRCDIESRPGEGVCVTLAVPFELPGSETDLAETADAASDGAQGESGDTSEPIRVMVVDDHRVMRRGLIKLLGDVDGISVIGEAGDGPGALQKARHLCPDVVIVDVSLPEMNGIEVTRRLREELPRTQVVGLSMFEDRAIADEMLQAGAAAYLIKSGPSEGLISAVFACRE